MNKCTICSLYNIALYYFVLVTGDLNGAVVAAVEPLVTLRSSVAAWTRIGHISRRHFQLVRTPMVLSSRLSCRPYRGIVVPFTSVCGWGKKSEKKKFVVSSNMSLGFATSRVAMRADLRWSAHLYYTMMIPQMYSLAVWTWRLAVPLSALDIQTRGFSCGCCCLCRPVCQSCTWRARSTVIPVYALAYHRCFISMLVQMADFGRGPVM